MFALWERQLIKIHLQKLLGKNWMPAYKKIYILSFIYCILSDILTQQVIFYIDAFLSWNIQIKWQTILFFQINFLLLFFYFIIFSSFPSWFLLQIGFYNIILIISVSVVFWKCFLSLLVSYRISFRPFYC